jgi:hypothetical protein
MNARFDQHSPSFKTSQQHGLYSQTFTTALAMRYRGVTLGQTGR